MRISGTLELASMTGAQYLKDFIDEIGDYINKCDFFYILCNETCQPLEVLDNSMNW